MADITIPFLPAASIAPVEGDLFPFEVIENARTKTTTLTLLRRGLNAVGGTINVKDYGATGNGIADDTTAIQSANDAAEASSGVVYFPAGTYLVSVINWGLNVSFVGANMAATTLKMKNGANAAAVVQTKGFAALTGGTSTGGSFRNSISDMTIDGNKGNNSVGRGLQIYGKAFRCENLTIMGAHDEGLYTEYAGLDNFSSFAGTLEASFSNISIQHNGTDGWLDKGPHDQIVSGVVSFSNGGWGWQVQTPLHATSVNTYLNPTGGIKTSATGCITGSDITGSTDTGHGLFIESTSGVSVIAAGTFAGQIGLEIQSPDHCISAYVVNCPTTAVLFNGGSANLQLSMANNTGIWFNCTNQNGGAAVTVSGLDARGTLFSGTPLGTWFIVGAKIYTQLQGASISAAGWTPVLPASNATLAVVGVNTGTITADAFVGAGAGLTSLPLRAGGQNIGLQSQDITVSPWLVGGATLMANTTVAPDGTTTADTVARTSSLADHIYQPINFTGNGTKVVSWFIKQGTSSAIYFQVHDTTVNVFRRIVFATWVSGVPVMANDTGTGLLFAPLPAPNGFYRVAFTIDNVVAANTNLIILLPATVGADGQTVVVWGFQVEDATSPSAYIPTTTATVWDRLA